MGIQITYFSPLFYEYLTQTSGYRAENFTITSSLEPEPSVKMWWGLNITGMRSIYNGVTLIVLLFFHTALIIVLLYERINSIIESTYILATSLFNGKLNKDEWQLKFFKIDVAKIYTISVVYCLFSLTIERW